MKILVAVKDLDTRLSIQTELCGEGDDVQTVDDGQAAWQVVCSPEPPQIVLLDQALPGLDGDELCRKARGTPLRERPHVILLLNCEPGDVGSVLETGADDYLCSPFDPDELAAAVSVARRTMQRQAEETASLEELYQSVMEP
jgi:DNA-binding response OmpR family regulator